MLFGFYWHINLIRALPMLHVWCLNQTQKGIIAQFCVKNRFCDAPTLKIYPMCQFLVFNNLVILAVILKILWFSDRETAQITQQTLDSPPATHFTHNICNWWFRAIVGDNVKTQIINWFSNGLYFLTFFVWSAKTQPHHPNAEQG